MDLTDYAMWRQCRHQILNRAVVHNTMPPAGRPPLSDAQHAAISEWARNEPANDVSPCF